MGGRAPRRSGRGFGATGLLAALAGSGALVATAPATAQPASSAPPVARSGSATRERFVVTRFDNTGGSGVLAYMEAGLPAVVAERLAMHPALRFAGPNTLISRDVPADDDDVLIIGGAFARQKNWTLEVTVHLHRAGQKLAEASVVAGKDEAPTTAVDAALAALAKAGRGPPPPEVRTAMRAPFGRDNYAFVLYGRGVDLYLGQDKNAADKAQKTLGRSLVIDPRVPETRRFLGEVHLAEGRPGHARTMWLYALDVRPAYHLALGSLAALDRARGSASALGRYAELLALDPDDLDVRRAHGELLAEAGKLGEAQSELEQVLAARPGDLRARRALTMVLASRKAGVDLARELTAIVRLDPDDLDARFELGAAQAAIGKLDEAGQVYEGILERQPRNKLALKLAGDVQRRRGDLTRAARYYTKLRRIQPTDPKPLFLLASTYFEAGKLDRAERLFLEGTKYPGRVGDSYGNLGAIALKRGHIKEALWFLDRAANKRPGKSLVRYNHGLALHLAERNEEALNELGAASRLDPRDAQVLHATGVVLLRLQRLSDAMSAFRKAVELDPEHEDAQHNLQILESVLDPKRETR